MLGMLDSAREKETGAKVPQSDDKAEPATTSLTNAQERVTPAAIRQLIDWRPCTAPSARTTGKTAKY